MIVCKLEMWPGGREDLAYSLGVATIANVGGDASTGEYDVKLFKAERYSPKSGVWKRGKVAGFPRLRLGPYDLLLRALAACIGQRNPGIPPGELNDTPGELP